MGKVILSVDEFMRTLKPGDKFWHMGSVYGEPSDINEITIERLETDEEGRPMVFYMMNSCWGERKPYETHTFVSDLTSRWHGVFLSERDAQAYFEERKHAYATDPELIAEVQLERGSAMADDFLWDDYDSLAC